MRHEIKRRRAERILGMPWPGTVEAILAAVPAELWDRLTAGEIATVCRALHASHRDGRATEAQAIIDEGRYWDPRAGKMLPIEKGE